VIFYGWLDRESLHRLYVRAHGIVAPSETEGWPKVLSEAMAHRVVPFAAAVGAVPETLARARAGKALPPGSAGLWASEIAKTAGDAEEWRRQADRAQAASRSFSYERYLESARLLLDCPETADSPRGVLAEEVR
jgi:glycosyltransferase involved in cell wall biosynthesis